MPGELLIPEGFRLVETEYVVAEGLIEFYAFKWAAKRRCAQANEQRDWPTYRYEMDKTSKEMRKHVGRFSRWSVVPYQNRLEKL